MTTCDHIAELIKNQTVSIEDQLILASNHVRIRDNDSVFPRYRRQHLFPRTTLADMKGRGIDIDAHVGTGCCLDTHGAVRQPNVVAYGHTDGRSVDEEQRKSPARTKIPAFIEYPVVGQIPFSVITD